ncbi:MAG: nitrous oxide reductase family maturation protein NosD [Magnetospirillum sp.]|nr:nitrous oxide reductase family maturation protein NosD [Magnetospirillum sp.]
MPSMGVFRTVFAAGLVLAVPLVAIARGDDRAQPRDAAEIQALIDAAPAGGEVVPAPGLYHGRLVIEKPIILDGRGKVTIDADGEGSVIWLKTGNATVKNLRLANTGHDHNAEDAGIQVRGNNNVLKDNVIEDCLFGIDMEQSNGNVVRRNHITSKKLELGMRGDSLKLWYSNNNIVEENEVHDSRDFVLWYSKNNQVRRNISTGGRYGLHFMFAADNVIENNKFFDNSVGLSLMYNEGDVIRNNYIAKSTGATGTCISLKEASRIVIENNDIVYCALGIGLDVSPFQPDTENRITSNRISYNDIAIAFLNDWRDNVFKDNVMKGNITEVVVFGGGSARRNSWDGNQWEDYEGFDRNRDGVGDTPHRVYGYAGRVWMDVPNTRFFKGTPLLEVLDFLDRLAPFSEPVLLLEDAHPRMDAKNIERKS